MKTTGVVIKGDEHLLSTLKQGNLQSLGELYKRYYPKVYHTCFSYTRNHDDAFDLAQDVMLKAFGNINAFEGKSTFSTWLFSITRNHCLSMISKNGRLYYEDVQSAHYLAADELSSEDLENREKKEQLELQLQHYIDLLPEVDKRMLELKYFQKYSIKDLQIEFDLSASAVKMRLLRARQRIEQILDARTAA
jgi:RNA polymerase sigma-70 factor (ECF subfamily)